MLPATSMAFCPLGWRLSADADSIFWQLALLWLALWPLNLRFRCIFLLVLLKRKRTGVLLLLSSTSMIKTPSSTSMIKTPEETFSVFSQTS